MTNEIKQRSLEDIKTIARNENKQNLYVAVEMLCDYIEELEIKMVKPKIGETRKGHQKGEK